jgi:hypothetical protein
VTQPSRDLADWLGLWLKTRLVVRIGGRSVNLDAVPAASWAAAIAPLRSPLVLVTAWNPQGRERDRRVNRAANHALRAALDAEHLEWCPALGRAPDGSWAEPGFAVGGLADDAAAALGRRWDQIAVYVVTRDEVAVLASDGSFREARPRGASRPR